MDVRMLRILCALLYLLVCTSPAFAATSYYAAPTGSGSLCTSGSPCTIQGAINRAVMGDTVNVTPGAYALTGNGTSCLSFPVAGTASAHITLKSTNGSGGLNIGGAKLIGQSACRYVVYNTRDYIDVNGFDVTCPPNTCGIGVLYSGSQTNPVSGGQILNTTVHDIYTPYCDGSGGGAGIDVANSAVGTTLRGNRVLNMQTYDPGTGTTSQGCTQSQMVAAQMHGYYLSDGAPVAIDNLAVSVKNASAHLYHNPNGVIFVGNTIADCGTVGILVGGASAPGAANNLIENNLIKCKPGAYGIREVSWISTGNIYDHNLIYGAAIPTSFAQGSGDLCTNCTIGSDPLLVNDRADGSGDYSLQSASPAIDAGAPLGAPYNTDFVGTSRPQGSAWDIGAYEYISTSGFPPNPILTPSYTYTVH